ncbi:hypothetical protein K432DRAFT_420287 [Lepidopterella palustris CBS 459.81]|uniref:Uncharacterized protein n=1 Tax=Lepidopterella palustris CBS 459.81 TaxID=1314670 RepID=A0A8E2J9P0_9PEZI|nr:hypothetical protein K432DRAFT_420287 [Lepidopterella palustris CBS 459.81]
MTTITRGNVEKVQGMFHGAMDGQTRSGKPTKRVLSEISNWDQNFDLERAGKEQQIKWRRAYTINWLYDLVNVFLSIVVQRNTMKQQNIILESVDWSTNGPWNKHRRLFGLNEFVGEITSLAMEKPGTDIRQKILPHTAFQLQCIVDSLIVSRGWSLNILKGRVLHLPARAFRPRRDVDHFMDRKSKAVDRGYCNGVNVLNQFFAKDSRDDFVNWLGESKYMYGLTTIPPSCFSNTKANGLWEYSPFLCGMKYVIDPATGKNVLEDTSLIRRARCQGLTDMEMIEMTTLFQNRNADQSIPKALLNSLPEGCSTLRFPKPILGDSGSKSAFSGPELLGLLELDIISDISGQRPVSRE